MKTLLAVEVAKTGAVQTERVNETVNSLGFKLTLHSALDCGTNDTYSLVGLTDLVWLMLKVFPLIDAPMLVVGLLLLGKSPFTDLVNL